MKITKQQLKQIIKEELGAVLSENDNQTLLIDKIEIMIDNLLNNGEIEWEDANKMDKYVEHDTQEFVTNFVKEVAQDGSNVEEIAKSFIEYILNPPDDLEAFNQRDKMGRV